MRLVEDSYEVISPEESNVPERANEIDSEPSSSFKSEGLDNVNRDLQVLTSTVSAPRELPVSELKIDKFLEQWKLIWTKGLEQLKQIQTIGGIQVEYIILQPDIIT